MQRIPLTAVRHWVMTGGIRVPTAISCACPHCASFVTFSNVNWSDDTARRAVPVTSSCPACKQPTSFWAMRRKQVPQTESDNPEGLFMYPPATSYYPSPEFSADVPELLQRAFLSAVNAFNSRNYAATAVCARRTLEGIFKFLVPEERRREPLARLIEIATENADFAEPLRSLSHAIRDGGNLGAHFDMQEEPTEELSRQMVDLLNYLISYLYVLPKEIRKLEASLDRDSAISVSAGPQQAT
jgi:hypothetical protein